MQLILGFHCLALRQALLGALGSFVDIRMIHEQLMGTQVLFLICLLYTSSIWRAWARVPA